MALDVFFRENLADALRSADMGGGGIAAVINEELQRAQRSGATLGAGELTNALRIYRRGYRDALAVIAAAFGIVPSTYAVRQEAIPAAIEGWCVPAWEE